MERRDSSRLRKEHEERCAEWRKISPKEQLVRLDQRLGKDKGAKKQRARIMKQMEATQ